MTNLTARGTTAIRTSSSQNTIHFDLFEPKQIKKMVPSFVGNHAIPLLLIAIVPPLTSSWIKVNLAILLLFILLSSAFLIFAKRLVVEFYLYMAFGFLISSINWLFLSLKFMELLRTESLVVMGVLYVGILLLTYIKRDNILKYANDRTKGNTVVYPVVAAAIGTIIGMLVTKTILVDIMAVLIGFGFAAIGFLFASSIILNCHRWILFRNKKERGI